MKSLLYTCVLGLSLVSSCATREPSCSPIQYASEFVVSSKNDYAFLLLEEYQKSIFSTSTIMFDAKNCDYLQDTIYNTWLPKHLLPTVPSPEQLESICACEMDKLRVTK